MHTRPIDYPPLANISFLLLSLLLAVLVVEEEVEEEVIRPRYAGINVKNGRKEVRKIIIIIIRLKKRFLKKKRATSTSTPTSELMNEQALNDDQSSTDYEQSTTKFRFLGSLALSSLCSNFQYQYLKVKVNHIGLGLGLYTRGLKKEYGIGNDTFLSKTPLSSFLIYYSFFSGVWLGLPQ